MILVHNAEVYTWTLKECIFFMFVTQLMYKTKLTNVNRTE